MIKVIAGLPENILGFEVSGEVTALDYESIIIPAVDAAASTRSKLRMLYHITPEFRKFDFGAMWEDAKVGLSHLSSWEKVALVTDVSWVTSGVKAFGFVVPGEVKTFRNAEIDDAKLWVAE